MFYHNHYCFIDHTLVVLVYTEMKYLLSLPQEILLYILSLANFAKDFATISVTCKQLNIMIRNMDSVWKNLYVDHFNKEHGNCRIEFRNASTP